MMKDIKINNTTTNKNLYPGYDVPESVQKIIKENVPKKKQRRTDLQKGQIVVVLEGKYASARVVFLKQTEGDKALCCGTNSTNNIPFFLINERYLLRTSTVIKIDSSVDIDESSIFVSGINDDVSEKEKEINETGEMKKIVDEIENGISKVNGMKRYMATPFRVPENVDFYSLNF